MMVLILFNSDFFLAKNPHHWVCGFILYNFQQLSSSIDINHQSTLIIIHLFNFCSPSGGGFWLGRNQNYTESIPSLNLICNTEHNRSDLLNLICNTEQNRSDLSNLICNTEQNRSDLSKNCIMICNMEQILI